MYNSPSEGFSKVTFATNTDFELGSNQSLRSSHYKIINQTSAKGLIVYIPGFGDDLGEYTEVFCKKISAQYDVAVMSVNYFCLACRPNVGGKIFFEHQDNLEVERIISENGGKPEADINANLELLKGICRPKTEIFASLEPEKNEYQNFGILAALDILNAIRDAVQRFKLDTNKIILIGSSYGGYVANIATKICPGYINSVFDNSSWAQPNLNYVVGRELRRGEFVLKLSENLALNLCVKSPWTLIKGMPNSLEQSRLGIRTFDHIQLKMMAEQGAKDSTFYCFYHSSNDQVAPTQEKIEMTRAMIELGFRVQMEIAEKSDIDGKFIKDLSHGMGMSMVRFFHKCYEYIKAPQQEFQARQNAIVRYVFDDCIYEFNFNSIPIGARIIQKNTKEFHS